MHLPTVLRILEIAQRAMTPAKFNAFRQQLRREYVQGEIDVRKEYLSQKVKRADIARQFEQDLVKLHSQLAALK